MTDRPPPDTIAQVLHLWRNRHKDRRGVRSVKMPDAAWSDLVATVKSLVRTAAAEGAIRERRRPPAQEGDANG